LPQFCHKIGFHSNVPGDIEIKSSDLSSTPKTLSYGVKIAKIANGLYFSYDTKLIAMELEKLDRIDNIHTNTFHLVKNRENRSSRY